MFQIKPILYSHKAYFFLSIDIMALYFHEISILKYNNSFNIDFVDMICLGSALIKANIYSLLSLQVFKSVTIIQVHTYSNYIWDMALIIVASFGYFQLQLLTLARKSINSCIVDFLPIMKYMHLLTEFLKCGILGSRIPDKFFAKVRTFLRFHYFSLIFAYFFPKNWIF